MALPPEPLEELVAQATFVFEGEVTAAHPVGADPPAPPRPPGWSEGTLGLCAQRVSLAALRIFRGPPVRSLHGVLKPPGEYTLGVGQRGLFLISEREGLCTVLGRHGPDSYPADEVLEAVRAAGRRSGARPR